jgi:hypothetical protein
MHGGQKHLLILSGTLPLTTKPAINMLAKLQVIREIEQVYKISKDGS